MAGRRLLVFEGDSLLRLLTHYTNGAIDTDARLLGIGAHTMLQREVGLLVDSEHWRDKPLPGREEYAPLFVGYDGRHVMTWGRKDNEVQWWEAPERPNERASVRRLE